MRQKKHFVSLFILILLQLLICADSYSQTWWKLYRNPNVYFKDVGYDICESTDGYFFIVGYHTGSDPEAYNVVYKINKYGDTLWRKLYLDTANGVNRMFGLACATAPDGGCAFSGDGTAIPPYVFRLKSNGDIKWNKSYEGYGLFGKTRQIILTPDNGYLLCGVYFLLKIDSSGNYQWGKDMWSLGYTSELFSIVNAFGGGYICFGYDLLQPSSIIPKLTKFGENGDIIWQKTYTLDQYPNRIRLLSDKYILMTINNKSAMYFAKINQEGGFLSQKTCLPDSTHSSYHTWGTDVINDNRFVYANTKYTNSSLDSTTHSVLRIIDSSGNLLHSKTIDNNRNGYYDVNSLICSTDGFIMCAGQGVDVYPTLDKVFAIRTDTTLYIDPNKITEISNYIPSEFELYQNYPNPFNSLTNIQFDIQQSGIYQLNVFNILGQKTDEVFNKHFSPGSYKTNYDMNRFSSGVYYYVLSSENMKQSKPLILLK